MLRFPSAHWTPTSSTTFTLPLLAVFNLLHSSHLQTRSLAQHESVLLAITPAYSRSLPRLWVLKGLISPTRLDLTFTNPFTTLHQVIRSHYHSLQTIFSGARQQSGKEKREVIKEPAWLLVSLTIPCRRYAFLTFHSGLEALVTFIVGTEPNTKKFIVHEEFACQSLELPTENLEHENDLRPRKWNEVNII